MTGIEKYLRGKDLRSTGRSNELVEQVKSQRDFDKLFTYLFHADRKIVMRAADAFEKITVDHPGFLLPHKTKLLELCATAGNIELKWHLAQLLPRLQLPEKEITRAWKILYEWAAEKKESRIVRVNALNGLAVLQGNKPERKEKLSRLMQNISDENIPSLNAAIRKLKRGNQNIKIVEEPESFCPGDARAWRNWLKKYHRSKSSVWLVYYKKHTATPSITYNEAVEEALCFGWIDSTRRTLDEERFTQLFSKRKPNSVWSAINKEKVKKLEAEGRMTSAGRESIEVAKNNGSWDILTNIDMVPGDLGKAFKKYRGSEKFFMSLSPSVRRAILQWLVLAKRLETRQKRIEEIER